MAGAKNLKGFTLIEIITVVIILGIMAAVLIPKIAGPSMEKSYFSEAPNHLSAFVTAEKAYFFDHDAWSSDCTLLETDVTFKYFNTLTCNDSGAGKISVTRISGGWEGVYSVKVDATQTPPVYSCKKGGSDCPAYLMKLLPQ